MDFKELRKQLIIMDNTLEYLSLSSREISFVRTKLQEASMWAGKMLGVLSGSTPYKNDGIRKSVKDIEPKYDNTSLRYADAILTKGTVATLDAMRQELSTIFDDLDQYNKTAMGFEDNLARDIAHISLCQKAQEARMWLGSELGRIRDAHN